MYTSACRAAPCWDIFCQVIDNFGDIGVCWRLAAELGARGQRVRLHVDDASALTWMAPQGADGVEVLPYHAAWSDEITPSVVIEAFGCEAPAPYLQALAKASVLAERVNSAKPVLINLEYLSAEGYVERCHRLPSPILHGPGVGVTRWFFYPGFTELTGGLLRETALCARQASFDRHAWRAARGLADADGAISLFCYEPAALPTFMAQLAVSVQSSWQPRLLITPGRAAAAVRSLPEYAAAIAPMFLPICTQTTFDEMLWGCDLNLVRGEDSLVRALWAGQPLVWNIYPQHDNAHHAKLDAFLDWLQAPTSLRMFHYAWNGMISSGKLPSLTPAMLCQWRDCVQQARTQLLHQPDLIEQLQRLQSEKS